MSTLTNAIGYGLVTAILIALSATAFSLQYSVSGVPNFAHGDLLTIGAYGTLVAQRMGLNLAVGAVVGGISGGIFGWLMYRVVLRTFVRRGARLVFTVAVTAGIALILENSIGLIFGNSNVNLVVANQVARHIGPFLWTDTQLVILLGGAVLLSALYLVLLHTDFGRAIRAISDNPDLARASGVRVERTVQMTWLMCGTIAGLAGVALAMSETNFGIYLGSDFLLVTFAAAIIGGIGKVNGAVMGALIIGVVTEVSGSYLSAGYKQVSAITILVIVLLVRPNGLLNIQRAGAEA